MKPFILVAILTLLSPGAAQATDNLNLQILIEENIHRATQSYQQMQPLQEHAAQPARLWIHVRNPGQKPIAQAIFKRLDGKLIAGKPIERSRSRWYPTDRNALNCASLRKRIDFWPKNYSKPSAASLSTSASKTYPGISRIKVDPLGTL